MEIIIYDKDGMPIYKGDHTNTAAAIEYCARENIPLHNASLKNLNLKWAVIDGLDARGSDFSRTNFTGSSCFGVDFRYCDLSYAVLNKSDVRCSDFTGANGLGCKIYDVIFNHAISFFKPVKKVAMCADGDIYNTAEKKEDYKIDFGAN